MIDLHHPHALWALLLVPAFVVALAIDGHTRRRVLEKIGHLPQVQRMTATVSHAARRWKAVLLVLAVACLGLALAQPQMPGVAHLEPRRGLDLVVALDFSRSMLAADVYPSRLERAKRELDKLIDGLKGDRVGLVAFAGVSMSYPLTNDYAAAKLFWRDLGPADIPVGGTNLSGAVRDALELLENGKQRHRATKRPPAQVIVLLTDGADTEGGSLEAAREAARRGVKIFSLGIGTSGGDFVQVANEDGGKQFIEEDGHPVRMRLDAEALRQMASVTGGEYVHVDPERFGVDRVQQAIAAMERDEEDGRVVQDPDEAYWIVLLPALALLIVEALLGERRRARPAPPSSPGAAGLPGLVGPAAMLLALVPALVGFDFFERPNPEVEQGNRLLAAGKPDEALAAYDRALAARPDDPAIHYDRGAALYAAGKMPEAMREFQRAAEESHDPSLRADALYNLGNVQLKEQKAK